MTKSSRGAQETPEQRASAEGAALASAVATTKDALPVAAIDASLRALMFLAAFATAGVAAFVFYGMRGLGGAKASTLLGGLVLLTGVMLADAYGNFAAAEAKAITKRAKGAAGSPGQEATYYGIACANTFYFAAFAALEVYIVPNTVALFVGRPSPLVSQVAAACSMLTPALLLALHGRRVF